MGLYSEMRRRNVFKVAAVYVIAAWLVVRGSEYLIPKLGFPGWAYEFVVVILLVGLPVALFFAWAYEVTPAGLKKAVDVDQTQSIVYKTGQKLNAAAAVLLVLVMVSLVLGQLVPPPPQVPATPVAASEDAPGVPPGIRHNTLDNGLEIIVWPDHDIPYVVLYNFVRVGSRNEYPGITGLAHFFEHMMFNGTTTRGPGEFDRLMEAAGAASNAYTTRDVTVYQNWFPVAALETVFELEGDRLENLTTDPAVFESERSVVASERRLRVDNDNAARLREQVRATAFVAHPYQHPIIGWPSDIERWTHDDVMSFYRTHYAPNNLTMVVTGDVTAEQVFDLADEYLASIPSQPTPAAVRTIEPEQSGERRVVVATEAQTPLLHIAFHAGSATDPGTLPMYLLMKILVDGESSRLHRRLVAEDELAVSVAGSQHFGFDPGLVYFELTLPPGADPGVVEQALLAELDRVVDTAVDDAELSKARNIFLADHWRGLATIDGKAQALGEFEVIGGDYRRLFELPAAVDRITADELREVAARVFRRSNMTVGVLRPRPENGG